VEAQSIQSHRNQTVPTDLNMAPVHTFDNHNISGFLREVWIQTLDCAFKG
jgi:hypothetical protein